MTFLVCPLSKVMPLVATRAPERIVSLLDPGFAFPETGPSYQGRHLRLQFHDVHVPSADQVAPTAKHIEKLLVFLSQWNRSAPMLFHCRAGIGRSPAIAIIAGCLHNPDTDERVIVEALRQASSIARPNETLIALADRAMHRKGRISAAVRETGRGLTWTPVSENVPFEMPASF